MQFHPIIFVLIAFGITAVISLCVTLIVRVIAAAVRPKVKATASGATAGGAPAGGAPSGGAPAAAAPAGNVKPENKGGATK